jgi:hypothetical protein
MSPPPGRGLHRYTCADYVALGLDSPTDEIYRKSAIG